MVFQHGAGTASRRDFQAEAEDLARAVASLLVDAPFNRPPFRSWLTFQLRDRAAYVQNVVDLRRAIDLLATAGDRRRPDRARRLQLRRRPGGHRRRDRPRLAAVVVMSGPGRITDVLRREGATWVESARGRGAPPGARS